MKEESITRWDSRYIIGIFLVLFSLKGFGEFVLTGSHSFTLEEVDFRAPFILVVMNESLRMWNVQKPFRFLFVVFLMDYLLKEVLDLSGIEKITLTVIPYLGTLSTLFIALSMMDLYYKRDNKIM